jgi:diaminopimelate decarboxylase
MFEYEADQLQCERMPLARIAAEVGTPTSVPSLYEAHHEIRPVARPSGDTVIAVDVVGPVCESGDFLARDPPFLRSPPAICWR